MLKFLLPLSFTRYRPRFNYFETRLPVLLSIRDPLVIQRPFVLVRPGNVKAFGATTMIKVIMVLLTSQRLSVAIAKAISVKRRLNKLCEDSVSRTG